MKKGWDRKTLGDLLVRTETTDPMRSPQTEFDYIDVSSVSNETLAIQETQRLKGKDAPSRARRLVKANDVLFATIRPTLRRIAIVPEELDNQVCSTGYFVLRTKPQVDHRYVFYFLQTEAFMTAMESLQKGASYPAVTDGDVRSQPIPVPPLAEQRRIVGLLDETFAGLATAQAYAEKNHQNARALFESHLQSVFTQRGKGWVEKRLEDVTDAKCSLSYGIVQPGEEYADGMPIVRPTDLTTKVIRLDGLKRINPKLADGYKRTALNGGELLLCVRGSTGVVSIAAPELAGGNVTRGIVPIRFDHSVLMPEFGFYLIRSEAVQCQIRAKTYGAALMQINIRDLRTVEVLIPPLNEQVKIAARLDALAEHVQRLAALYARKQAALAALKQSLLHQAFAGEL